jgi:addiction module HigA family antidote
MGNAKKPAQESKSIPMPADWLQRMKRPPTHPGDIFREFYRQAGTEHEFSQAECARRMGMSTNRLNEIERGKRGVSPETAVLISALTNTSAEFWCSLQNNHALWHAYQSTKARAKKIKPLYPKKR